MNKVEILPGISDHEIVYIESNLKPRQIKKPPRKVFQYKKANTDDIKRRLNEIDLEKQIKENTSIDNLWNYFKCEVLDIMNSHIPTKMINNSKHKLPWINREVRSLIRKRNKTFKKMKEHPSKKTQTCTKKPNADCKKKPDMLIGNI